MKLSEFARSYNLEFESNFLSDDFISNFLITHKKLSFFGGVGGNVISKVIVDVIERNDLDEVYHLLCSLNSSDNFIGIIAISHILKMNLPIPDKVTNRYDKFLNSNIVTNVNMACTNQDFKISNYPNSFFDSLITTFIVYGSDSLDLRVVDNY